MKRLAFIINLCFITLSLAAIPAKKGVIYVPTADGDTIGILLYGDENHSFRTTTDGYLIKECEDGNYYFAEIKNSMVTPTSIKVTNIDNRTAEVTRKIEAIGKCDLQQMTTLARAKQQTNRVSLPKPQKQSSNTKSAKAKAATGSKGLVILVSYSDLDFSNSRDNIYNLLST